MGMQICMNCKQIVKDPFTHKCVLVAPAPSQEKIDEQAIKAQAADLVALFIQEMAEGKSVATRYDEWTIFTPAIVQWAAAIMERSLGDNSIISNSPTAMYQSYLLFGMWLASRRPVQEVKTIVTPEIVVPDLTIQS